MVQEKWDAEVRIIPAIDLQALAKARKYAEPKPALPNLQPTWESLVAHFRESLRVANDGDQLDYGAFDNLTAFAEAVALCDSKFLDDVGFPGKYEAEMTAILYNARTEMSDDPYTIDPDELRAIAGRGDSIASSMERLGELSIAHAREASVLANRLRENSTRLEREATEKDPSEPDYDYDGEHRSRDEAVEPVTFDVGKLFSEL